MVPSKGRRGRKPGWSTKANDIVDRVFAYGTFRSGESARAMIAGHVDDTIPATVIGTIYAFPEGYPGMVAEGDSTVVGEVLMLNDLTVAFALLDAYEGDDYERTLKRVTLEDGTEVWAWIYLLRDPTSVRNAELIPSGDWTAWRATHG